MRRRTFIAGLGSAAAWPVLTQAQQDDRVRRIGVLTGANENDPEQKRRLAAFTQALAGLGWTDGRNVRMDPIYTASVVSPIFDGTKRVYYKQQEQGGARALSMLDHAPVPSA
jgi:hypothetical protein